MKMMNRMSWGLLAAALLPCVGHAAITLQACDAKLTGGTIKMQEAQAAFWKKGETAEWTIDVKEGGEQFLTVRYASMQNPTMQVFVDDVRVLESKLSSTKSWGKYADATIGKVALSKGAHTVRLLASQGKAYCFNVRSVTLSANGQVVTAKKTAPKAVSDPVSLKMNDAQLKNISMWKTSKLIKWKKNGTATWEFATKTDCTGWNLQLNYSAQDEALLEYVLDGVAQTATLKPTGGLNTFRTASVGAIDLPAGAHTLVLCGKSAAMINLQKVILTSANPPPFTHEYSAVYEKKATWAETLVAMRAAYADPAKQNEALHFGKKIDMFLNMSDGKALWTNFPRETDWFLQDNQVHGKWGEGVYDARQDYKNYLNPSRDNTLEQKLIAQVLPELGKQAASFTKRYQALIAKNTSPDNPAWLALYAEACEVRRVARLAPLVAKTDKIVYATHMNMGVIYLATETQPCPKGSQLRMIDLSPLKKGLPITDEVLFDSNNGIVRDPELSFDGKKMLFAWRKVNTSNSTNGRLAPETGNYKIYEMDLATREIRALTTDATYGADFEPCYLPSGDIVFSSARCVQEVTCGWGDCSNLYIMDKDGNYARRLGFDQTQTGFPHLLNDGRIIYTRRDYNDRGQSYAHALFVMNTDGTTQTEYYGNNSMAPTSIQHTRSIPGSRKTMGIAGGYHTSQGGKLVVIDPKKGRQNYEGLTFYNWEPTPLDKITEENHCRVGEQFVNPFPLDEESLLVSQSPIGVYLTGSNGKLNKSLEQKRMQYKLYYMTLDGRRELLASDPTLSCTQAIPVMPRTPPATRASGVDYTKDTGTCYVQNVYYGKSAEGIEPGSVKKLRINEMFFKPITIGAGGWGPSRSDVGPGKKYSGYGWHSVLPAGVGSASFDAKEILGEVEVHADGSAMFEVPARTPIFFQLIDEDGLVIQTMRSWTTLMPNENFSCVGCHEENDSAPLPQAMKTMAMQQPRQVIQPVPLITGAPFSYNDVVQPILDKHCVSCHAPGKKAEKIDLSGTLVSDYEKETWASSTRRKFNQSYLTLLKVKWDTSKKKTKGARLDEGRPNDWVSYYTRMATVELTPPYYAGSTQSGIIKMMMRGHGKVKMSRDEIRAVAAWIDLNVPSVGEYDAMNIWDQKAKDAYQQKLGMRIKQEEIEAENIKAFIGAGQP